MNQNKIKKFYIYFLLFILPTVYCLDFGKDIFQVNKNQKTYTAVRSFYANTSLEVSLICSSDADYKISFSRKIHPCLPLNISQVHELTDLNKESTKFSIKCHGSLENRVFSGEFEQTGVYLYRLEILGPDVQVMMSFNGSGYKGYLSPQDFPLLPFYSVLCVVYSLFAFLWLFFCCLHWRDLLRVQFWIGAVIFMGMLEKAMFAGEYDTLRKEGLPTGGLLLAAEFISSLKKTTSRMLVIIVSLGFGIIKPRLGTALHQVTFVGIFFFVLSFLDGIGRTYNYKFGPSSSFVIYIALALTDSFIFLWIFTSLLKTIKILTIRKNTIKLSLYRHFRNVLIFCVLVSLVFTLWSTYEFKFTSCFYDWEDLWWETSFWHLLFCVILFAIIILWRPSANNQRYAYSPLYDVDEEDEEQTEWTSEAVEVKKIKKSKTESKQKQASEDKDLKWVEENIPSSKIDKALNHLVDSDNDGAEVSKMD